ncbi:uncharacterized protein [Epargyreus clarus]|uniref:uncharacterized protein isoform X2 n=1 Tax=Epargyreus clarus TaxID=520877 RepID=UPI003C30E41A
MNRNRKIGRNTLKREESSSFHRPNKNRNYDIEEVLPPRSRRNPFKTDKYATDRSCYFTPEKKDFSQLTEVDGTDQYQNLLLQQYGFDPIIPETIHQLKELRKVLCASTPKVDDSSQYINPEDLLLPPYVETADGSHWQNIEDADEIDEIIEGHSKSTKNSQFVVKNMRISEIPRIKVIAEKFSRFKKNNVELRRLDEKVVCIEYDVFEGDALKPAQKMRAYFSIRPGNSRREHNAISNLPSNVKHEFDIAEEDLKKLNDKEIEIIDGKVAENKPYVDDLRKVLKRKQAIYIKKNKSSLDLRALYEMAKSEKPTLDDNYSDTNLLSKAELDNVKDLILKKCTSSMYGINRKTIKPEKDTSSSNYRNVNVVSQSIFAELLKNGSKHT